MIKIDLGSAFNKGEGYIGVDIKRAKGVDIVHDCNNGLPFSDNYADEIRAYDFLEHIQDSIMLMNEIWRVLKPDGVLNFNVPDASRGQGAFQDPTHRSFWVKKSFLYYTNNYYRELYNIKAKFNIKELEEVSDTHPYWGETHRVVGTLQAIKEKDLDTLRPYTYNKRFVITTDDLCLTNLEAFSYWDKLKIKYPSLKLVAFTIANYRENERLDKSKQFKKWFTEHKDWVEIGVHGYDHDPLKLPEGERDDFEKLVKKSLKVLKPFLPKYPLYRPPGFQTTNQIENIIKRLGFRGIAHEQRIKYFNGLYQGVFNTHCTENTYDNPIGIIWKNL